MDGMSYDPLRQKANYLKSLVSEAQIQVSSTCWVIAADPPLLRQAERGYKPGRPCGVVCVCDRHFCGGPLLQDPSLGQDQP